MSDWTTNTTAIEIADWLRGQRAVVLLTHTKPDGDALGSTLALARAINLAGGGSSGAISKAECWYAAPVPAWAKGIIANTKTRSIEPGQPAPGAVDPSGVVVTDTGSWNQLEPFAEWLRPRRAITTVIDHHRTGSGDVGERHLIVTGAAAVTQPVADVCMALLGLGSARELPVEIAEPLYVGLATDTGWFKHSNVTPAVMRLGADLLEAGVNHGRLFELIEQRERPARLRLFARALASLDIVKEHNLALMSLTADDFKECGAAPGESGGFSDILLTVESIRVAAMLNEQELSSPQGPLTKISLRSKGEAWKDRQPVDVSRVCAALGGGGHARAAGARVRAPLAQTKRRLIEALV